MVLPTLHTLNPRPYTINPEPYILIPKPRIRDPQASIIPVKQLFLNGEHLEGRDVQGYLHPPCTLHPAPYTLHPAPYTLHPTPYTLHPTPETWREGGDIGGCLHPLANHFRERVGCRVKGAGCGVWG